MEQKIIVVSDLSLKALIAEAVALGLKHQQTTPQANSQAAELVTAEELRERLDICKASERSYVKSGLIQPHRLGKRVYYRWDEVTAALSSATTALLPPKLRSKAQNEQSQKTA